MGFSEVFLKDVAPNEIVVIRKAVPEVEIAREKIAYIHALFRQCLRPRRPERSTEECLLASGAHLPVSSPHRDLLAIGAHPEVLGVGSFELGEAEREVVA